MIRDSFFYKQILMKRIYPLLIAIDQLVKVLIWGGNPDVTISDYVGRRYGKKTVIYKIINTIFFWQKDHCSWAFEEEEFEEIIKHL